MVGLAATVASHAAEKLPDLRPPLGEIPPGIWEQHGMQIMIGSAFAVAAIVALVLWLLRKKPPVVIPPAVTARKALEALGGRKENLTLAAEVSQIMRRYVLAKRGRAGEEPTTEELVRGLSADTRFDPTIVQALAALLRDCDVQKFAPAIAPQPDLVSRAFGLVEQFEIQAPSTPA